MNDFFYDVSLADFETRVLQPSLEVPVFVDFLAPWCGPCKTLTPMLEKLAGEYSGRFLLAKVDSDQFPQIAQHFGVRSIPTVKVLFKGRLVDEFSGALPESELRAFIDRIVPPPAASLREEATALIAEGRLEDALALLVEASQENPQDEAVRLDAAEVLMDLGRQDEANQLLAAEYLREADRAQALRVRAALAGNRVDTAAIEARLAANADDHAARLELSRAHAAVGQYREALTEALEVVRRDRFFEEGAGRKAMLEIFTAIGGSERHDDLVREFRRALSAALN